MVSLDEKKRKMINLQLKVKQYPVTRSLEMIISICTQRRSPERSLTDKAAGGLVVVTDHVQDLSVGSQSSAVPSGVGGRVVLGPGSGGKIIIVKSYKQFSVSRDVRVDQLTIQPSPLCLVFLVDLLVGQTQPE